MTQADRVFSTPPTNTPIFQNQPVAAPSRRRFLSQAASVAAGGTAMALATVSATAGASAPMAAVAPSGVDPIVAAIATYRAATQDGEAVVAIHVSPTLAVANGRSLVKAGWQVRITDQHPSHRNSGRVGRAEASGRTLPASFPPFDHSQSSTRI